MAFKLSGMADVLRKAGVKVVEVEGWKSRGYAGQDLAAVRGVMWHHTATNRAAFISSNAPTLNLCINGREDLAGPLCNIVLGRDGTAYIVAAGVANHAGTGFIDGIPANAGNHYMVGIEMESSGIAPWDWTAAQLTAAPRIGAALESTYGASIQPGHLEYSNAGKIDPAGWPGGMDGLRASINAIIGGNPTATKPLTTTKPAPIQEDEFTMAEAKKIIAILTENQRRITETREQAKLNYKVAVENQRRITETREIVKAIAAKTGTVIDLKAIEAAAAAGATKALAEGVVKVDVTVAGAE